MSRLGLPTMLLRMAPTANSPRWRRALRAALQGRSSWVLPRPAMGNSVVLVGQGGVEQDFTRRGHAHLSGKTARRAARHQAHARL